MEASDEQSRCFHVNRHDTDETQVGLEFLVVFPDAAVGRVDGACPIVPGMLADGGGDGFLQVESRQGRDFRREIIVGCPFAADRRDRQDQVAETVLPLETAAFTEQQAGLGLDRTQQIHDRGGIGTPHPKVDQCDAIGRDVGHGFLKPAYGGVVPR